MKRNVYIEGEKLPRPLKPYQAELDYTFALQQLVNVETKLHGAIVKVPGISLHVNMGGVGFVHSHSKNGVMVIAFTVKQRNMLLKENQKKSFQFRFRTLDVIRADMDQLTMTLHSIWNYPDSVIGFHIHPITRQ